MNITKNIKDPIDHAISDQVNKKFTKSGIYTCWWVKKCIKVPFSQLTWLSDNEWYCTNMAIRISGTFGWRFKVKYPPTIAQAITLIDEYNGTGIFKFKFSLLQRSSVKVWVESHEWPLSSWKRKKAGKYCVSTIY